MTHEELKPVLEEAGFVLDPERTVKCRHYTYQNEKIAVCYSRGWASAWEKSGAVLLPFTEDLEQVKQEIE